MIVCAHTQDCVHMTTAVLQSHDLLQQIIHENLKQIKCVPELELTFLYLAGWKKQGWVPSQFRRLTWAPPCYNSQPSTQVYLQVYRERTRKLHVSVGDGGVEIVDTDAVYIVTTLVDTHAHVYNRINECTRIQ